MKTLLLAVAASALFAGCNTPSETAPAAATPVTDNPVVNVVVSHVEDWAYQQAKGWLNNWIHSHLGASPASKSAEDRFVQEKLPSAKAKFPGYDTDYLDSGLRSAYRKAAARRTNARQ